MKKIFMACAAVLFGTAAYAQTVPDAYRLSQPDLKGTARYMSMAGAFGALGGDLTTLSHNPAGIGVYRNSEVGFTLDLDLQNAEATSPGQPKTSVDQTKFLLNNIGFVWTLRLPSSTCPNLNFGFTYNKTASFNRRYRGQIGLTNSLSNYMAATTTEGGYVPGQLVGDEYNDYDPYNPYDPSDAAPWLSIMGYQSGLFFGTPNPNGTSDPYYVGEWGSNTRGVGLFDVEESGAVDSYNIALGGNISNVVFWGMDFDITHMNYNLNPMWTETLQNARVLDTNGNFAEMDDAWSLLNYYNCSGTGFNYKLGFIVKPIQELRLGFAFQTPTWYSLTETFSAGLYNYLYDGLDSESNDGWPGYNDVNFRTPWKINASAAAVLFNSLILSAEYEWTQYTGMKFSMPSYSWGGDYWYPDDYYPWDYWSYATRAGNFDPYISNDPYYYTNQNVSEYYSNTNTFRFGAEYRIVPQFSVRAGYSFVSSPVKSTMKNAELTTAPTTMPNYRVDNTTSYVTCGVGYRIKSFYLDLAYVYKHMSSDFHAFSPWYDSNRIGYETSYIPSQTSSLSLNNSQIVLSAGFKF